MNILTENFKEGVMINLLKNNDERTDSDTEWIEEFYCFLKGVVPEGMEMGRTNMLRLSKKKAFSIIWYLQEHFPILPDHIEVCWNCDSIFDVYSEGLHWETKNRHYCGSCTHLVPEHYDRGRH